MTEKLVYQSSNGDRWYLGEDPATSLPTVKHVANRESDGHITYIDLGSFLSAGAGPSKGPASSLSRRTAAVRE
jgi:hypothetical protein